MVYLKYNKVFLICNYCADYGGNFLASFDYLANKLLSRGVIVYFVFPKESQSKNWEIDLSKYRVIYCNFNYKNIVDVVSRHLNKNDSAVIHLNFVSSLILTKFKTAINNRTRYVFHQHMAVNFGAKQIIKGIVLRLCAPKDVAYIGVSPKVYRDVKKEMGGNKSYLVLNAIDTDRLTTSTEKKSNDILIFGTDFMRKGVDLAIAAIKNTKISRACNLLVVTHNQKSARQLIINKFNEIPNFVKILPPSQNVEKLYKHAFLFLSPSRLEAFGYAVVEAAYSGDQVIISDVSGQNVLSKIPGVKMIQSENIQQLRSTIINAYENRKGNRKKANAAAHEYIDSHYSLEHWTCNILKIYDA